MKKTKIDEIRNDFRIEELEQRFELKCWLKKHDPKNPGFVIIIPLLTTPGNGQDGPMVLDMDKSDFQKLSSGGFSVDGINYIPDAKGVYHFETQSYIETPTGFSEVK